MSKKHLIISLVLISFLFLIISPTILAADKYNFVDNYRILFLSSYSPAWDTVPYQTEGIISALNPLLYTIEYEYMDAKNIKYGENYLEYYEILKHKLSSVPVFDGLIVGDDAALKFALLYKDELFKDMPIVFHGIDDISEAILASQDPLITGIVEKSDFIKNFELAKSIQPKAKDLIFIYDGSESGLGLLKQLKNEKERFSDFKVHYFNSSDYSSSEICGFFSSFPEEYMVFLAIMGEEKGNKILPSSYFYHLVNHHIKYPTYRSNYTGIGKGVFGGYIIDHQASGNIAGKMMVTILEEGKVPEIVLETPHLYIFDYHIMEKYKISQSQLPQNALIINKPKDFLDKYSKNIIQALVAGIGAMAIGLLFNIRGKRKLRATNYRLSEAEKFLKHQNYHDSLTDLPNRKNIVENLELLVQKRIPHAVFIVDIDDFKEINMAHGSIIGDMTLTILSNRLLDFADDDNLKVGRFGGDEFLVLLQGDKLQDIEKIALGIKDALSRPIRIDDMEFMIQVSMGIAVYNRSLDKTLTIIPNASMALDEAKKQGKNAIAYYNNSMRSQFTNKKRVEKILLDACRTDGFKVLYQPQVDIRGNIVGYEALLRLKNNASYPDEFIAVAEGTDLILRIGRIVTKKVVKQMAQWAENGMNLKPVSINFSNRQIRDKGYVDYLDTLLKKHKIRPDLIEIEVTENIFINNDKEAEELFDEFLSLGVNLALDDFGTGYSSINYLTYIPVNKIKIDRTLVQHFINKKDGEFIGDIISLAHGLGLEITIEGIESFEEYKKVERLGANYVQGYYFSKPLEAEEIVTLGENLLK